MAFVRAPPDRRPRLAFYSLVPAEAGCAKLLIVSLSLLHQQLVASASYSTGTGVGRRNAYQGSRVSRGASPSSFFGQSPSESLITGVLLGGAVAAVFFIAFRRSFGGWNTSGSASPVRKDEPKVFRPCASICLNEVVLQRGDGNKFCIKEPSVGSFLSLCSWSKLYVFVQVKDDEEEHQVMHLLERIKAFDHGLQRYRVMFSSTREGRASMVRQLQPLTHIDADGFIAITLDGKVPNVVCLREPLKDCVDVLQAALHSPGS